ncbi:MAG: 16S rRNA (adenine(1518)-N(6)/adenine(1519)-N(6))-dimethyltransferase, partial [Nitrospirota bacterium]|nr:16S rRNA (adenine(1518)-N(6)/adenine(1519)-N(6))-dimethyltransferase [Nitrospirota bacterium]
VQAQARAKMCFKVLPGAFRPPPKVTSAVVRVDPFPAATAPVPPELRERFMSVVRAALGQRRKTVANALTRGLDLPPEVVKQALAACGIPPATRGETLGIGDFLSLTAALPDG